MAHLYDLLVVVDALYDLPLEGIGDLEQSPLFVIFLLWVRVVASSNPSTPTTDKFFLFKELASR
jgi:hypothetical protein